MKADSENPPDTAPKHTDFLNQSTIMSFYNQDSSPSVPTPPSSHLRVSSPIMQRLFSKEPAQSEQPQSPFLHTPVWTSPFTSIPAQDPPHLSHF